jgi:hypothetical protein
MRIGLASNDVYDQDQAERFYTEVLGFQINTSSEVIAQARCSPGRPARSGPTVVLETRHEVRTDPARTSRGPAQERCRSMG